MWPGTCESPGSSWVSCVVWNPPDPCLQPMPAAKPRAIQPSPSGPWYVKQFGTTDEFPTDYSSETPRSHLVSYIVGTQILITWSCNWILPHTQKPPSIFLQRLALSMWNLDVEWNGTVLIVLLNHTKFFVLFLHELQLLQMSISWSVIFLSFAAVFYSYLTENICECQ